MAASIILWSYCFNHIAWAAASANSSGSIL